MKKVLVGFQYYSAVQHNLTPEHYRHHVNLGFNFGTYTGFTMGLCLFKLCVNSEFTLGSLVVYFRFILSILGGLLYAQKCDTDPSLLTISPPVIPTPCILQIYI